MMLYVNGQDIARLVLGLVDGGAWRVGPTVFAVGPEAHLATVDAFVREHGDFDGIVLVTGPGSATALRTSVSMVNALAYAMGRPLYPIEKAPDVDDATIVDRLADLKPVPMAVPVYAHGARITAPTKDALKRRIDG